MVHNFEFDTDTINAPKFIGGKITFGEAELNLRKNLTLMAAGAVAVALAGSADAADGL